MKRTQRQVRPRATATGASLASFAALLLFLLLLSSEVASQALKLSFPVVQAALAAPAPPSWVSFAGDTTPTAINVKWDKPSGAESYQLKYVDEVSVNLVLFVFRCPL